MKFIIKDNSQEPKMLPMEGRAQNGDYYQVNSKYLIKNSRPFLPVMGEFHFSRWHPDEWAEAILKMKAGGVDIAATYVFWIHHEERQGEFDFTGSRNLRRFLETCKELDMPVWLRIGPWCHGEARNGGFPDWIAKGGFPLRQNHPEYLKHVKNYWTKLAEQAEGMMCKDGGPIIGIQLENEYGHCYDRPKTREEGFAHLRTLKEMAVELGFVTPYYTVTAWGGAYVLDGETLPVYGGYVDAPWAQHTKEQPASEQFLFIPFHDDKTIGSDLAQGVEQVEKDTDTAPYLTAELGGGLQVTAHRRTYPYPEDIEAQALCMLGAGANLIGYYMYHGGYNPDGRYSTLQESKATGYYNDLPIKSYDFQTCIRESGLLNKSYGKVKKWHLLIRDFQEILAPTDVYLPDQKPSSPEDLETVRAAVRHNHQTGAGFLFINNHQRKRQMQPHQNWSCRLSFDNHTIELDGIDIATDDCLVIPYNLPMGATVLEKTNASLLCRLGDYCIFYTDNEPRYQFSGQPGKVITLSTWEVERAYKFGDKLLIADCALYEKNGEIYALSQKAKEEIIAYGTDGERRTITVEFNQVEVGVNFAELGDGKSEDEVYKAYQVKLEAVDPSQVHELYLKIDYLGDKAEVYHQDQLIADWFTTGDDWYLALKRYGYPQELELRIYPSNEDVYFDLPVEHGWELKAISAVSGARAKVNL